MSFQNYDSYPGQQPADEGGAPGAGVPQPQQPPMGQPIDNGAPQFQGPPAGGPGSDQQGAETKTTLWYGMPSLCIGISGRFMVFLAMPKFVLVSLLASVFPLLIAVFPGWVSLNPGSMRALFVTYGSTWASKLTSR
jgi:hypothetical protein